MTAPLIPDAAVSLAAIPTAVASGSTDAVDLAGILADAGDIEVHRLSLVDHHTMNTPAAVMSSLARLAGLREQIEIEVRLIRNYYGGPS
jgi:hypothetical protein